jgi:hypothetical protein
MVLSRHSWTNTCLETSKVLTPGDEELNWQGLSSSTVVDVSAIWNNHRGIASPLTSIP